MSNEEKHFYEFGPFRLDPVKRRLMRDGEPVPLTPKAFDTLLELVRQSGKTIEKDDLMQKVWNGSVVEENNLNQSISALRRSLGDSRHESQYIATIPGLGYRFVAEVKKAPFGEVELAKDGLGGSRLAVEEEVEQGKCEQTESRQIEKPVSTETCAEDCCPPERVETILPRERGSGETILASLRSHRKVAALALALIIIGAAGAAFLVYKFAGPDSAETAVSEIEMTPLTRTGTTGTAAISPDGRHIIYSVREGERESLWLRQVATSSVQRVVAPAQVEYRGLTFSRDGNYVFFVSSALYGPERALYRMPALGGVPIKLLSDVHSTVTLSPDGSRVAFVRVTRDESLLMIATADGSQQHKLAARPMTDYFKVPAWSPDGKMIACTAGSGDPYDVHNSVVLVRVEDGSQRAASPQKWAWTRWVEWLADGSGLLVTAREKHETSDQIWHIAYPGGATRRITGDSKMYLSLSLTADSQTLAAVQTQLQSDIWVAPLADTGGARKITSGTGYYLDVCFAPDGRIVYGSQASGNMDVWIMNVDGSGQKQLTAETGVNAHPSVSPDGRHIVFASNRAGVFNIWRMDSDGGNPVQLTRGGGEKNPQYSPDGRWIVYNSVGSDESLDSLWKISIDGGEPVRLTERDSWSASISPDGRRVAYFQGDGSGGNEHRIVVISIEGGPPERTFDIPKDIVPMPGVRWFPDGQGLTYSAQRDGISNIWRQPLDGGPPKQITDFKAEGRLVFNWSLDGKQLVFIRRLWTPDLVLLKNFAPGKS